MAPDSTNETPHRDAVEIQPGRRRPSIRGVTRWTLPAPMGLSRVALKAVPAFAGRAAVLNFVAHPDDDLLFLSPDLLHAIQAGGNLRTVYLTAGDAGLHASYWQDRESGVQAAYAEMAGVANSWTQSDAGVAGHPIPVFTLTDQRNVSLAFIRLPDGDVNGSGFASNGYQSLQDVWTGSIATIEAVDRSSGYTLSTLTSTLAYFITSFQAEQVNTLDYRRTYGDGDHSDHHTVGYLTRSAIAHCNSSVAFIGYEGYPVIPLPANVSDADQKAKQSAFFTYVQHDKPVRDLIAESASTPYDSLLVRQYRVNQPRSLIAHCRGLAWRGVRRARLEKTFEVILSFAIRAKRGLLAGRRAKRRGPVSQADKLRVQVINTEQGFDALETTWTALYDEAGISPFQTFAWQRAWWRHYAEPDPRMRLFILVVRHEAADKESAVIAIAPFFIERRRVAGMVRVTRIRMIGQLQSDYLDLLVQPVEASASLAALAGHLRSLRNRFDVLVLQDVPDHSPSFSPFLDALEQRGFRVKRAVGAHCPRGTFGPTWEQTEQALPSATRRTMRKSMRKLVMRHGAELELVQDLSRLDEDLADLFALHQRRWTRAGLPGTYGTAVNTGFFREAAYGLAARGQLVLAFLRLDGGRVAGVCGFRHRDEFHSYAAGLGDAGEAARYSPGMATHLMLMRALLEDGVRVYDHLRGMEQYKADLGGIPVPTWRAAAFGRPAGFGRGVSFVEDLQRSAQRRFEHELQQLRALRANPACGAADIRRHVAERLATNFTDTASRLRRHR